jgi:hypothetical protein
MLTAKVTLRAGGYHLSGDYLDLQSLHRSLHEICHDESDGDAYPENLVFQLAYDVRKAMQGHRAKTKMEGFSDKPTLYRTVTLSLPRALIQFAFTLRLVVGRSLPMQHTANIHAFGATLSSALGQLDFPSPEGFIASVSRTVSGWPSWPDFYVVDLIDMEYLYQHQTKRARIKELKHLPENLRYGGPFANAALRARAKYAKEHGVAPETLGAVWPDEAPKY